MSALFYRVCQCERAINRYCRYFEYCMYRVLGEKTNHVAGSSIDGNSRKKRFDKFLKQMIIDTQNLDSKEIHCDRIEHILKMVQKT